MTNEPLRLSKQIKVRLINRPTKIIFVVPVITLNDVHDILELRSVWFSLYIFTKTVLTPGCFFVKGAHLWCFWRPAHTDLCEFTIAATQRYSGMLEDTIAINSRLPVMIRKWWLYGSNCEIPVTLVCPFERSMTNIFVKCKIKLLSLLRKCLWRRNLPCEKFGDDCCLTIGE